MKAYETVIGLEVHVELATNTKIFCGCTTQFGGEPNTHCCPICTGMPGTLPRLNARAVDFAMAVGLATHCKLARHSQFDRKHYFYPDLPKAFQTSQLYLPLCADGHLDVEVDGASRRVGIREIHLEEDAGKLLHDPFTNRTLIDYNRGGVPLIEIVTLPDMRTADEVIAFLAKLKATLQYLGVSDCKMQEGSLRADVNLSVRRVGARQLGTRTEMKNMNSFKAIARAIAGESARQIAMLEEGEAVRQETRRWDENKDRSFAMRSKEDAQDYRYFPEPDIPPLVLDDAWIARIQTSLPELPDAKRARYQTHFGLSAYDAAQLTAEKTFALLFDDTVALGAQPKEVANWILGEISAHLNARAQPPEALALAPGKFALILSMQQAGRINRNGARQVLSALLDDGEIDPAAYIAGHALEMVSDASAMQAAVQDVLQAHADLAQAYVAGNEKVFGYLVGQAMKALAGKAEPKTLGAALRAALEAMR